MTTFQQSSPVVDTVTGRPQESSTMSEEAASKASPRTSAGSTLASRNAVRDAVHTLAQISSAECSA
jgi:hypothetical protein